MPEVVASTVVDAPADEVWGLLRDFGGMSRWHPAMAPSEIEGGGPADAVGCVRVFTTVLGPGHRDRLTALDDRERTYAYTSESTRMPIRDYRARVRVLPVTEGDRAFVEWSARFDCDADVAEKMVVTFRDIIFAPGLAALRKRLESR
ncbi:SRPBCC family protein [Bailinhaonella thermotolerans]|uniref:SRPBCC family protein n=1 Tax=Bailinhaonella thermotolerans TaxID=1070861 RepID=A0A3A4AWR7_9ACTN|nr:SRPBCC family protein [Bailinhaonella thermotolerans]RJL30377.1 SRPBCC family protein [Bailinhaonella thermotolerans]